MMKGMEKAELPLRCQQGSRVLQSRAEEGVAQQASWHRTGARGGGRDEWGWGHLRK